MIASELIQTRGLSLDDRTVKLDAVARQVLQRMAPLRFELAETPAEREALYRLRYAVVVERGWGTPAEFPDGLERDEFDEAAVHVAGWAGDQLIATARIILPSPGYRLPTEQAFDLVIEPRGEVTDLGRFVVTRSHSDQTHRVLAGLLARAWLAMRAHGFVHACAAFSSTAMRRVYRLMGFEITTLGPARHYWGEERVPIRFDVLGSASRLEAVWGNGPEP